MRRVRSSMPPSPLNPLARLPQATPPPVQVLDLLREHSLSSLAQRELERRILCGDIAAGTKLNEVEVATTLGISFFF